MKQEKISLHEMLIRKVLTALACNGVNMATALIETDMMSPEQIMELEKFLQDHDGEITEEQFLAIAHKEEPKEIMTKQDQMAISVMDYLNGLNTAGVAILDAVCDENLEQSYKLIKENPKITKEEFLERMQISED